MVWFPGQRCRDWISSQRRLSDKNWIIEERKCRGCTFPIAEVTFICSDLGANVGVNSRSRKKERSQSFHHSIFTFHSEINTGSQYVNHVFYETTYVLHNRLIRLSASELYSSAAGLCSSGKIPHVNACPQVCFNNVVLCTLATAQTDTDIQSPPKTTHSSTMESWGEEA